MNKFDHINSIADLDAELVRIDTEKKLIKNQMAMNIEVAKESLKPTNLIWMALKSFTSKDNDGSNSHFLLKVASDIVTTVQASKYGISLIKKLFK